MAERKFHSLGMWPDIHEGVQQVFDVFNLHMFKVAKSLDDNRWLLLEQSKTAGPEIREYMRVVDDSTIELQRFVRAEVDSLLSLSGEEGRDLLLDGGTNVRDLTSRILRELKKRIKNAAREIEIRMDRIKGAIAPAEAA